MLPPLFDAIGSYIPVFVFGAAIVYASAALTWRIESPEHGSTSPAPSRTG